jgi:programmed cell death protein 5
MDDELEALRKKRLRQLENQQHQLQDSLDMQEEQRKQFEAQKKTVLRSILTTDAKERLNNIKVARPDLAESIENQLIMLAQSGRLQSKINDEQLRVLLSKILPKKRDIHIRRR